MKVTHFPPCILSRAHFLPAMSSDGEGDHTHSSVERLKSLGKRSFNEDAENGKGEYPAAKRTNIDPGMSTQVFFIAPVVSGVLVKNCVLCGLCM